MNIIINGKEYVYTNEVRSNTSLRHSFNELAKKIYGIDFEGWFQNGFWGDDYIPYVLTEGETVIANISVNIMHINYSNKEMLLIQLGTVMTEEHYRKQGLSRWLMEKILEEWKGKCDDFYLFANASVLDFYPKFGFMKEQEYQVNGTATYKETELRKLDMTLEADRKLLYDKYALSNPFSDLTVENNRGLLMFYCSQFMKENVYYLPQFDLVVIAEYDDKKIICYDVFGKTEVTLQEILAVMVKGDKSDYTLGFTPKDKDAFSFQIMNEEDTTLFWLSEKESIFHNDSRLMFPLLSHA